MSEKIEQLLERQNEMLENQNQNLEVHCKSIVKKLDELIFMTLFVARTSIGKSPLNKEQRRYMYDRFDMLFEEYKSK